MNVKKQKRKSENKAFRRSKAASPMNVSSSTSTGSGISYSKIPYLFFLVIVIVIVVAAFVFHLRIRFQAVDLGYKTNAARHDRMKLLKERRNLRLELASLKSLNKVEEKATSQLNMTVPEYFEIFLIGKKDGKATTSGRVH